MKRKIRLQEHRTTPPSEDVEKMLAWVPPDPSGGLNAYYAEIEKDMCGNCKHFRRVTDDRGQRIERARKYVRFDHWTCPTHERMSPPTEPERQTTCSTCVHWRRRTGQVLGHGVCGAPDGDWFKCSTGPGESCRFHAAKPERQ